MKKFWFMIAVSTAGLLLAMPSGAKAQKHTPTPLINVSELMPNLPLETSSGPQIQQGQMMNQVINNTALKGKSNYRGEKWYGELKNQPKKKRYYCEM